TRDPRGAIKKIHSLLRAHGVLSIETPDTDSWDFGLFKRRYWGGYHIPRHFYIFNKASLCLLLDQEGFEVISCKNMLSPVFWIHSARNFLIDNRRLKKFSVFFHYQNPFLLAVAACIDLIQVVLAAKSSNLQIVARKKGA
ncbi:MAG: methyltransferase domain-containing protein, partial [Candidatus Omnitrophota bacterium]